ncbi:HNH endonuclease [Rubrivirga marina]|uniref:HNH nuclease domain-containing protein n=1 Tax=Rubrivirga marina TaxID=1196024 RepID=A0A271J4X1_9BACT|nr:HNH endonuclease signature motif containing protein [Rubrivirga marina]PAP78005.1 hypothetical protein BSZ37_16935 [Rubrivirga marina]
MFTSTKRRQRFCSRSCYLAEVEPPGLTCGWCERAFRRRRADCTSFCARECVRDWQAWKAKRRAMVRARNDHARRLGPCAECGRPFVRRRGAVYCSDDCRASADRRRERERTEALHDPDERACRECQRPFVPAYGTKRRVFCSDRCARRHSNRATKAARRVRLRSNGREAFDPLEVLRRDGWRCQVCGEPTPAELRGTTVDRAPEVAHVVPLALSGAHTRANVRCECRACNRDRTAKSMPELLRAATA